MLGGLYGLNTIQHSYLILTQAIPSVVGFLGLFYLDDALSTLVSIQLIYLALPYFYIRFLSKEREIKAYFIDEFRGQSQQIKQGLSLCGSAFGMGVLSLLFTYFYEDEIMNYLEIPLKSHPVYVGLFMLIMTLLNPLLEEWFWRIFLMKTYSETENYRVLINSTYTLFHLIILFKVFNDWEFAIGFSMYFYSIGRAFEHIRSKFGLITCLLAHYGMTFASSIAILIVFELIQ